MPATIANWSTLDRIFHWVMAILVITMIVVGVYIHGLDPNNPAEAPTKSQLGALHKATGMLILALVTARLGWRLATGRPALPATVAAWQRIAAYISHASLYLLMFAMPVSGYVMSSYAQRPVNFYGLFEIPPLPVEKNIEMAKALFGVHETLAMILLAVILVHVAGALKHHFIDRDGVLVRMLRRE
jgi:cytochrome b561